MDPFDWVDHDSEDLPNPPAKKPVFDGDDPLAIVRDIPPWVPTSPVSAEARPEWDMRIVIDFVLGASEESICEAYELMPHQYQRVVNDVGFQAKVAGLKKHLEKEGATFTLKAQIQAETLIDESFRMAMDPDIDARVRAKLINDTVRWAGFDKTGGSADGTGGFSININLGGLKTGNTYDGIAEDV